VIVIPILPKALAMLQSMVERGPSERIQDG
jgi:hypothetical protein